MTKVRDLVLILAGLSLIIFSVSQIYTNIVALQETKQNNVFMRNITFENAIAVRQLKCDELGQQTKAELLYDIARNRCIPNVQYSDNQFDNTEITDSKGYRGLPTPAFIEQYKLISTAWKNAQNSR